MTTRNLQLQDISPLLEAIAAHFQGWTAVIENAHDDCCAIFTHDEGAQFKLWHSKDPSMQRLSVYGIYPETHGRTRHKQPEITLSRYRPAAAIAKEIHRRFLPEYFEAFKALEELKRKEDVQREQGKQNFATLTDVFADCLERVRIDKWNSRGFINLSSSTEADAFTMHLEAYLLGATVDLKFNDLPVQVAKQLLEVIRTLPPSEA